MKISSNLKILVVDDDLDMRNFMKTVLRKKGFKRVLGASDGAEALEQLKTSYREYEPVSLILADWQMPEIDGISFLTRVRLDDRFKEVPFIMITADNDSEHVKQAIDLGVDNYIIKPLKPDVLFEKISKTLENH